jgi:hypothetical protein
MPEEADMTENVPDAEAQKPSSLSPLETFLVKLAAATCAALLFFYVAFILVTGFIEEKIDELAFLKGGAAFWSVAETKLYKLASAQDMPPKKKEQIISALRILSQRYRPYLDAIAGDEKIREQGR